MASFFPSPYSDELLYSLFIRYHKSVGNKSYFNTSRELLGNMNVKLNLHFGNNIH